MREFPAEIVAGMAAALFDNENTARLQEHPEEQADYERRAAVLLHHMSVLGLTVTRSPWAVGWDSLGAYIERDGYVVAGPFSVPGPA